MRIDAHHHLWQYSAADYSWIDSSMQTLRRDFLPANLAPLCAAASVDATIAVQARQTIEETYWLLSLAKSSSLIQGVVGWADIAAPDFAATLDALRAETRLKGLRHIVQAEPAGFLDSPRFNHGIATMRDSGLVYDILIYAPQLPEAIRFVDRHPQQSFVLDHIAKPSIAAGEITFWRGHITELALRPNVACKLSGMVTEANWDTWTPGQLQPYFDTVLHAFGPYRLMAASDWPMLNLAGNYASWWQLIDSWLARLSQAERDDINGLTAARIYNLRVDR